jgi:hypothetical protein
MTYKYRLVRDSPPILIAVSAEIVIRLADRYPKSRFRGTSVRWRFSAIGITSG